MFPPLCPRCCVACKDNTYSRVLFSYRSLRLVLIHLLSFGADANCPPSRVLFFGASISVALPLRRAEKWEMLPLAPRAAYGEQRKTGQEISFPSFQTSLKSGNFWHFVVLWGRAVRKKPHLIWQELARVVIS